MKKLCIAAIAAIAMASQAMALETSVAPKVTSLNNPNPKTGLFVGNSYTYFNCGVIEYVRKFAAEGKQPWSDRMITISAGRLVWHPVQEYFAPHPQDKNDNLYPKFDVTFLQAQSTAPFAEETKGNFQKGFADAVRIIRENGSEPVAIVTWARQDAPEQTKLLADATIAIANEHNVLAIPVGLAFAESIKGRPELILHAPDKGHPSAAGSYLYGLMVYSAIFKKSPEGFSYLGACEKPLKEEDAKYLQSVAWKVTKEFYGW